MPDSKKLQLLLDILKWVVAEQFSPVLQEADLCVCVCVWERERVCMCGCERESVCVCVFTCIIVQLARWQ